MHNVALNPEAVLMCVAPLGARIHHPKSRPAWG